MSWGASVRDGSEDAVGVDGGLSDRLDSVEQLVELARELLRRLHRHDLIGDELERVVDEIELAACYRQVARDLLQFVETLEDDREVLPRDLDAGFASLAGLDVDLPARSLATEGVEIDRVEIL